MGEISQKVAWTNFTTRLLEQKGFVSFMALFCSTKVEARTDRPTYHSRFSYANKLQRTDDRKDREIRAGKLHFENDLSKIEIFAYVSL